MICCSRNPSLLPYRRSVVRNLIESPMMLHLAPLKVQIPPWLSTGGWCAVIYGSQNEICTSRENNLTDYNWGTNQRKSIGYVSGDYVLYYTGQSCAIVTVDDVQVMAQTVGWIDSFSGTYPRSPNWVYLVPFQESNSLRNISLDVLRRRLACDGAFTGAGVKLVKLEPSVCVWKFA